MTLSGKWDFVIIR